MKYFITTLLFLAFPFILFSQQATSIKQLKVSPLIPVYMPVMFDSTDVNKKTFEHKDLLKAAVSFDEVTESKNIITANEESIFTLDFAPYDPKIPYRDKAIQLLSFNIDADRYCKATLSVTSTDIFEIYVNNKLEKSKETKEDSLSKASATTIDLTLEPKRYEVIIKRLAGVKNFNESKIEASITPDKKDSLTQITITTEAQRRITINDIIEGDRLSSNSSISPSGNYFIVETSNTFPGGKKSSNAEIRETKSNKVIYRFPSGLNPRWTPETDQIVYSKQGLAEKDLYLLDINSLEEKKIAENIKFDSYRVSPDHRFILLQVQEEIPADKGDLKRLLSPADRAGSFRKRNSVYLYEISTKTSQRITFGKTNTYVNDISPDSKKSLLISYEEDITQRPFMKKNLFELDLTTLEVDTLFSDPYISGAQYSPDNKFLLITGSAEAFGNIGSNVKPGQIPNLYDNQAFILERKSGEIKAITRNFDPNISYGQWTPDSKKIYFLAEDKDRIQIFDFDLAKESFTKLSLPEDMIRNFHLARKSPIALFQGESSTNAYRLYSLDLKTNKTTLLADPFKSQLDELALSKVTDWNFSSSDGTPIEGRYYLPYDFDSQKKYPLIVYYYGGTSPTSRVFESTYPLQVYAALGYVVYTLQPSGTTGFGQEFAARHVNAWGELTANEIIDGTKEFYRQHSFVDSTKIGCIGASYGGFMTQYLQTKTNIFAAAVSHAGISNIASYWGEGFWGYSYSAAASANSYPWNNPDLYTSQSPLFSADKINTPLLLLHGSVDTNVPIGESIQMYNALKILGKPVEFITVEGENHAIYGYQKRISWNNTIYAWFAKWLKNQPEWWEALYPEK